MIFHRPLRRLIAFALVLGCGIAIAQPLGSQPTPQPLLRLELRAHAVAVTDISSDAKGRYALTVAGTDKTARVWETGTGKLVSVLRPPIDANLEGVLFSGAISPDGTLAAVGGITGTWTKAIQVYVFEVSSGRMLRRLGGLPDSVASLQFSPDGRWLAAGLVSRGLRVWDTQTWGAPLADADSPGGVKRLRFSPDASRIAFIGFDGNIGLYELKDRLNRLGTAPGVAGRAPYTIAYSPDGKSLAVGYNDSNGVDVFDASTLQWRFRPDPAGVTGSLTHVAWSSDGALYAGGRFLAAGKAQLRRWPEAGRGAPRTLPTPATNAVFALEPLPDGRMLVSTADPEFGVLDATGGFRRLVEPPIVDLRGTERTLASGADGSQIAFGFEGGLRSPYRLDLLRRMLSPGQGNDLRAPDTTSLDIKDWHFARTPLLDGKPLKREGPYEPSRSVAIAPDRQTFALGADRTLRLFNARGEQQWLRVVPGPVWGLNIPASNRVIVGTYADGTIRWHRVADGQEVLAFFAHPDRKRWVLWTPSGYYDASAGGDELIGWHLNRDMDQAADFFPAARFRSRFHRPDIIDLVLETLDEREAFRLANAARGAPAAAAPAAPADVARALPPVVELLTPTELQASAATVTLRVRGRTAVGSPGTELEFAL